MKITAKYLAGAAALAIAALPAAAQDYKLRIQTHFSAESTPGQLIARFIDEVQTMTGGAVEIQMHYSSEVVAQTEVMSAASQGILDCDMGGITGNVGKDAGWQLAGDIMGGYDTPYQFLSWFYHAGGREVVQEHLYDAQDMQVIGFWLQGHESLSSTSSLAGFDDLKDWKFRSPPGMATKIFSKLGAKPIVMDFTEIFTALETGIIDGADAAGLANNIGLGLYDIVKHTNYPGFHSMPSDHLACNKAKWDAMPDAHKRIMTTAMEALALRTALSNEKLNSEAAVSLKAKGVTLHEWSAEDRQKFRDAAQASWAEFATTPEAKALVESHLKYLKTLGLVK